jgi:hypothetical protein
MVGDYAQHGIEDIHLIGQFRDQTGIAVVMLGAVDFTVDSPPAERRRKDVFPRARS